MKGEGESVRVHVYEGDEGWGSEIDGLRLLVQCRVNASSKWQASHAIRSNSESAKGGHKHDVLDL